MSSAAIKIQSKIIERSTNIMQLFWGEDATASIQMMTTDPTVALNLRVVNSQSNREY